MIECWCAMSPHDRLHIISEQYPFLPAPLTIGQKSQVQKALIMKHQGGHYALTFHYAQCYLSREPTRIMLSTKSHRENPHVHVELSRYFY